MYGILHNSRILNEANLNLYSNSWQPCEFDFSGPLNLNVIEDNFVSDVVILWFVFVLFEIDFGTLVMTLKPSEVFYIVVGYFPLWSYYNSNSVHSYYITNYASFYITVVAWN